MNNIYFYKTKIGEIGICENGIAITGLYFGKDIPENTNLTETILLKKANKEIQEYLTGKRKYFDLPLASQGTEFQKKVWRVLREVPYGRTCSYKEIAIKIGNDKASRAVGMANNKNPIPIFIPCHRVIGSNGDLVGYAGGLDIKRKLLKIEKENTDS